MANPTITFNTRSKQKYDTYANWMANDPILLDGEIAIVTIPASTGAVVQEPAIMLKVGDGVKTFSALPFQAALAADVYAWAKASAKPVYTATEITDLEDFISGK